MRTRYLSSDQSWFDCCHRWLEVLSTLATQGFPKAIYFTNVTVSSYNTIEVKGIGDNVEAVNSYTDALRNDPKAQSAELVDIVTRKGKVNFTLKATLNMEKEGSPL